VFGHFLPAAARRLGRELAKVRTGEDEPTPQEYHLAVRDVIAHCVHGVDVNPLAVDLCKLALWLEGHWTGKPLSFLDHRIKFGNSLIGVLNFEALTEGVPDEAFSAVTGDDKKVASAFKKKNREERKGQPSLPFDTAEHVHQYSVETEQFVAIPEDSPADVRRKKEAYEKARQGPDWWHDWVAANLWTAAFFLPFTKYDDPTIPTHDKFMVYLRQKHVDALMEGVGTGLATELKFFHWPLEFPEVFERGGFDLVLGNPPWERIKVQEEEHWGDDPYIGQATNKTVRARRLDEYRHGTDSLKRMRVRKFDEARHYAEALSKFVRQSGRFPLTAVGDVNTYALFAELARTILAKAGRLGIITPTGIATDDTYKGFFADVMEQDAVVSLFDFENRERIFSAVYFRMKFALLTLSAAPVSTAQFAFYLTRPEQIRDSLRTFTLTRDDLSLLNPNTRTCPVFRTRADAELTKAVYRRIPVLVNDRERLDPWEIVTRRVFDMNKPEVITLTIPSSEIAKRAHKRLGNVIVDSESGQRYLPVYEGKMFAAYNHRAASVRVIEENIQRSAQSALSSVEDLARPDFLPSPHILDTGGSSHSRRLPEQMGCRLQGRNINHE